MQLDSKKVLCVPGDAGGLSVAKKVLLYCSKEQADTSDKTSSWRLRFESLCDILLLSPVACLPKQSCSSS